MFFNLNFSLWHQSRIIVVQAFFKNALCCDLRSANAHLTAPVCSKLSVRFNFIVKFYSLDFDMSNV